MIISDAYFASSWSALLIPLNVVNAMLSSVNDASMTMWKNNSKTQKLSQSLKNFSIYTPLSNVLEVAIIFKLRTYTASPNKYSIKLYLNAPLKDVWREFLLVPTFIMSQKFVGTFRFNVNATSKSDRSIFISTRSKNALKESLIAINVNSR